MALYNARTRTYLDEDDMYSRGKSRLETFENKTYNFTQIENIHEFFYNTKVNVGDVILECYIQPFYFGDFKVTKITRNEETKKAHVEFSVVNLFKPYNIEEEDYIPLDITKAVLDPTTDHLVYHLGTGDTLSP